MCWVALDRLLSLERKLGLGVDIAALEATRAEIRSDIEENGFDPQLGSFVAWYRGREPEASLLSIARYGFLPADDPRMLGTFLFLDRQLSVDGFLHRYPPAPAGAGRLRTDNLFGACSFWKVDYLARLGRTGEACELFERLLSAATPLGLYAEEFDIVSKAPVGNFPQAFTHLELIASALTLERSSSVAAEVDDQ